MFSYTYSRILYNNLRGHEYNKLLCIIYAYMGKFGLGNARTSANNPF